ncbi:MULTISPECIES: hypothetical protein [unclassified Blastococcus]
MAPVTLPTAAAAEARAPDGAVWRRVWSLPGRLVVDFPGLAALEAADDGTVTVDRTLPPDLEAHLLLDHLRPLLLARRGELVLHAAVVALGDRAAVLLGASGAGKSTLSAYAWQRGWTLGGDDGAVLRLHADRVEVEPTCPTVRLTAEAAALLGIPADQGAASVGKRRLRTVGTGRPLLAGPVRLVRAVALERLPGGRPARYTALAGVDAHAALFGCTLAAHLGRGPVLRSVVDRLGRVAESVGVGRLEVPRGRSGLADAERLLRREVTA